MSLKKMIMICLVLMFIFQVAPAMASYKVVARNLIAQAIAQGDYTKLVITNRDNGATGAAAVVAREEEDPGGAALIMIEVGQALIGFGNNTRKKGGYPLRQHYYGMAEYAFSQASKYINAVARENPLTASNMAINLSLVYFNVNPQRVGQTNYPQIYRVKALQMLDGSNQSAEFHARKIKNKGARKLQMQKIKNQRRAMGSN